MQSWRYRYSINTRFELEQSRGKSREIVSEKKSAIDFRSCEIRTLAVRKVTLYRFSMASRFEPAPFEKVTLYRFSIASRFEPAPLKKWRCIDIRWRRDSNPRCSKNIEKWKWRDVDFESIWDSNLSWIRNYSIIRRRTSRNRYFGSQWKSRMSGMLLLTLEWLNLTRFGQIDVWKCDWHTARETASCS